MQEKPRRPSPTFDVLEIASLIVRTYRDSRQKARICVARDYSELQAHATCYIVLRSPQHRQRCSCDVAWCRSGLQFFPSTARNAAETTRLGCCRKSRQKQSRIRAGTCHPWPELFECFSSAFEHGAGAEVRREFQRLSRHRADRGPREAPSLLGLTSSKLNPWLKFQWLLRVEVRVGG